MGIDNALEWRFGGLGRDRSSPLRYSQGLHARWLVHLQHGDSRALRLLLWGLKASELTVTVDTVEATSPFMIQPGSYVPSLPLNSRSGIEKLFFIKAQIVKDLDFVVHTVSLTTAELCRCHT